MANGEKASATSASTGSAVFHGLGQTLLDALPMPAYLCDRAGVVLACNGKAGTLWRGLLRIGDSDRVLQSNAPLDAAGTVAASAVAAEAVLGKAGPTDEVELMVKSASGEALHVFASVSALSAGEAAGDADSDILLKCFRVASRRDALADDVGAAGAGFTDLHRSERNFALLVANVTDYAIYMLDPQGIVTNWNVGAERIKGYRAEEIIGQHFSRFYPQEERARGTPTAALATARREGHYLAEGWRVRKDGSRFWASVAIAPILDAGRLIGFAKVTRDVTERREAETALVESEQLARGVIDTSLDGFAQLDEDERIVQWNPQAEALFGWSRSEALGQRLASLVVAAEERERFAVKRVPASGHAGTDSATRQIVMRQRAGTPIPVELSISSLVVNGKLRTNVFIRDLREKLRIEAQLRQSQKMEAVGQLTGGLAHDFNNLLQGIIGSLDLIQLRVESGNTSGVERFIHGALNSANRAAALTHHLLAFSRRQPLDPRPLQANPLLQSMAELLQRTLGETVTLTLDLAQELWPTLCDPNQLESALLNLTLNARDAMPDGGQLVIRSRNLIVDQAIARQWPDVGCTQCICIEVADNGMGMDAQVLEHAFEPFFTTKAQGQGSGLGLSMVYGFARQSNGHCDIRSEAGQGSTVRLFLPRDLAPPEPEPEQAPLRAPAPADDGEVVLVVEDEPLVRGVVVEVLHQLGYAVLEALDGESALAQLQSHGAIQLLISDIGLPGMNGRALADAARERQPALKILLMTGYAADASAAKGYAAGMEVITKPFTVRALADRLRRMLGVRASDPGR